MHLAAFITLLRENLLGMFKESKKSLYRIVNVLLEVTCSLSATVSISVIWHMLILWFLSLENMLIRSGLKSCSHSFFFWFHMNDFSVQNGKVSPSCEDSSASRWKV